MVQAMLDSREDERESAAAMGKHDVEFRKLVERAGCDELRSRGGMFEREAQPVRQARLARQPLAVNIRLAVERVE